MAWRNRLRELILAGGALATAGCSSSLPGGGGAAGNFAAPCGNGIPDPCICDRPALNEVYAMQCNQKMACEADGGVWNPIMTVVDGEVISHDCDLPDGGID